MRFHQISANFHKNWVRHCNDHRKEEDDDGGDKNDDAGDKNDDVEDDAAQPEAAELKKRNGPKRAEPPAAAPVRRRRDSAGDLGTQNTRKPKGQAACKKNPTPE